MVIFLLPIYVTKSEAYLNITSQIANDAIRIKSYVDGNKSALNSNQ